eukprot:CAMPEP_0197853594 /NCGR_PEP_ID=MMETSP1438-20131217/23022_1 /TAXON_ID=1461541 /ORGANISM="Pterosperma sp., Strain CCMP1384" /LENGTH=1036 /DNA_ID=CAMNT_0043468065 /DNA_START=138 /DNA_END=3245 /DNA_ORIENTATION=+
MGCVKSRSASREEDNKGNRSGSEANGSSGSMGPSLRPSRPQIKGGPLTQSEYNDRIVSSDGIKKVSVPSANIELEYAYVSQRGYYPDAMDKPNQDSFRVVERFTDDESCHFFGVFDGHGEFGTQCSQFAAKKVPLELKKALGKDPNDLEKAHRRAFVETNRMLRMDSIDDSMSGTTGISVYVKGDTVVIANVGDSRACAAVRPGPKVKLKAQDLSTDQTPFRDDECERVEKCGARVLTLDQLEGVKDPEIRCWGNEEDDDGDPPRLWAQNGPYPGTAFTRSIGDYAAEKIGVYAEPEVKIIRIGPDTEYIIIASDGVFEFLSSQMVVSMVGNIGDPHAACNAVVSESYRLWLQYETRTDDITIIIIQIKNKGGARAGPSLSQDKLPQTDNRPVRRNLSKQKRAAIQQAAEDDDDDEPYAPPKDIVQKTPEEIANIDAAVKANFLFSNLSDAKRKTIYEVMLKRETKPGEVIIKQGDKGDHFYVIEKGEFDVYVARPGEESNLGDLVHTYCGTGNAHPSFGELALMYGKPRAATVKCKTQGTLWQLDRRAFKGILHKKDNKSIIKVLRSVEVLQSLNIGQLQRLADVLTEESFEDSQYIIKQGATGNEFYIIDKGSVVCTVKKNLNNPAEVAKEVLKLGPGQYFGERALLGNAKRAANVIAKGRVKCLHIGRDAFEEVLGPLQNIINEDRKYREKAAELKQQALKRPSMMQTKRVAGEDLKLLDVMYTTDISMVTTVSNNVAGKDTVCALKAYSLAKVGERKREAAVLRELSVMKDINPISSIPTLVMCYQSPSPIPKQLNAILHCVPKCALDSLMLEKPFREAEAAFFAAETILTLEHLHFENCVYRSIQPDTILVDMDGHLLFVDFQFAKQVEGPTYTLCGNPEYLAPEMVDNSGHTAAVDFWSLGIMIFYMLTGQTPFANEESELKIYAHILEGKRNANDTWKHLSPECQDVINKLLSKDPNSRLGSPGTVGGIDALKKHKWFQSIEWDKLGTLRDTHKVPQDILSRLHNLEMPEIQPLEIPDIRKPASTDFKW